MYGMGEGGLKVDYTEAARWFGKAAAHKAPRAEANLATLYMQGLGVPYDPAKGATLYLAAAKQGDLNSEVAVAMLYEEGLTLPRDMEKAVIAPQRNAATREH